MLLCCCCSNVVSNDCNLPVMSDECSAVDSDGDNNISDCICIMACQIASNIHEDNVA